jgi:hypothetical protein
MIRKATFEASDLSEFDQVNQQSASLNLDDIAYVGSKSARISTDGSPNNAFARGIFFTNYIEGDAVYFGVAVKLDTGFKAAMQGEVALMRWDNWDIKPVETDRGAIVIQGSDKKAYFRTYQDNIKTSVTGQIGPFNIEENKWTWLEVYQKFSTSDNGNACTLVWLDGTFLGLSKQHNYFGTPVTRFRYGLVADAGPTQTNELKFNFDRAAISSAYIGPAAA